MGTAFSADIGESCDKIAAAIKRRRLVPFVGAGINMCGRTPDQFVPKLTLPNGSELASHLAERFGYPPGSALELARVAQYAYAKESGPLYEELAEIFRGSYPPNGLHRLFAAIRPRIRLFVTTNYDDLLERSLDEENEMLFEKVLTETDNKDKAEAAKLPYDVVWYEAEGKNRGRFIHLSWQGAAKPIEIPNSYHGFQLAKRSVILKIHGAIDRVTPSGDRPQDSFVIAEDQYLDYLLRSGAAAFLPTDLSEEIGDCHILFVGYGLKDWNMRVLLRRVWQESRLSWPSWAVQRPQDFDAVESELWKDRNVVLIGAQLDQFRQKLQERL
jgi:hypothetical protein